MTKSLPVVALLFLLMTVSCGNQQKYTVHTLPSGKQVKIIAIGPIMGQGWTGLMLKYQTDLKIADSVALLREVEEMWPEFRVDVERAGVTSAIISANEIPSGFILTHNNSFNFIWERSSDGSWHRL